MDDSSWTFFLETWGRSIFMGVDCSSRAVHAVLVDEHEQVVGQGKWRSSEIDFNVRFLEMMQKFMQWLNIYLKIIINQQKIQKNILEIKIMEKNYLMQ